MWDIGLLSANKTHEWTNRKQFVTKPTQQQWLSGCGSCGINPVAKNGWIGRYQQVGDVVDAPSWVTYGDAVGEFFKR